MRPCSFFWLLRFVSLFLLTACADNLQELKEVAPVASNFSSSLAAEYLAYSESRLENKHKSSSQYFASKGLRAARGEVVEPDVVSTNAGNYQALSASRLALVEILTDAVKHVAPQKAARAQMLFDCWNEQESNKILVTEVSCAVEFSLVYDEVQIVADNLIHGAYSQHTLQFAMDSKELDSEAKNIVAEIAKHMEGNPDYVLELNTHHDIKNKKTRQGRLAYGRFVAVRDAFIKAGVPSDRIFSAHPNLAGESGSTVLLSNDKAMQDSDEVNVVMTSLRNLSVMFHD